MKSIYSRFIRFITNIADGKKNSLKRVLAAIKTDVRSTTGKNLRYLLLKTKNFCEKEITTQNEPYQVIPINKAWRLQMINELIDAKCGDLSIILTKKEIDEKYPSSSAVNEKKKKKRRNIYKNCVVNHSL